MTRFINTTVLFSLAVLCRTYLPFLVLGLWNRAFGGWRSVFFCYAGNARYSGAYAPGRIAALFRWVPSPIGVLTQGEARGLVLASCMTESDFLAPANAREFERFLRRLRRIAWLMGVEQVHMAGILPSVLRGSDVLVPQNGLSVTVGLVTRAAEQLVQDRFGGVWPPVIVLGGEGYVGRALVSALLAAGCDVRAVDPKLGAEGLPTTWRGRPTLMIDAARAGALRGYLAQMWPGLLVLNETFPEPGRRDRAALAERGVELWHLAGAEGSVWPDLPGGYAGAVPCCAVHVEATGLRPVLRCLVPARAPSGAIAAE